MSRLFLSVAGRIVLYDGSTGGIWFNQCPGQRVVALPGKDVLPRVMGSWFLVASASP